MLTGWVGAELELTALKKQADMEKGEGGERKKEYSERNRLFE